MTRPQAAAAPSSMDDDITTLNDEQLDQLMAKHRRPDGNFELPVGGWEKLPDKERDSLVQRLLEAQDRVLSQNPAAISSGPLDLDELNARLAQVSENHETPSSARPPEAYTPTEPYDEEDQRADLRDLEADAYHQLVSDGGRPLYSIRLLEQVSKDPDEYEEMLWPFWDLPPSHSTCWPVYQKQLERWQKFRIWQNDNRCLQQDEDDGYSAYVEMRKRLCIIYMGHQTTFAKELAQIEADPEHLRSDWDKYELPMRKWQRRHQREPDCHGFSNYADAVKRRLTRHGFARPFQLHEDPKQQDQLTTWVEYLCFEYWWLDWYTKALERLKPDHDKRWQELVDQKMLMPHETAASVRISASSLQRVRAIETAQQENEAAEVEARRVYVLTQQDPNRLSIPQAKRVQMLRNANKRLTAAKDQHKFAKTRADRVTTFIRATFDYNGRKRDVARQTNLLQWALRQIPLIEADLQSEQKVSKPDATGSKKRNSTSAKTSSGRSRKRQKSGLGELGCLAESMSTPVGAPSATLHAPSRSPEATQGSRTTSPARRVLRSVHGRRAAGLGAEQSTPTAKGPEEPSPARHKSAEKRQKETGKRRRGHVPPIDDTPAMRRENAPAKPFVKDTQVASSRSHTLLRSRGGDPKSDLANQDDSAKRGSKRQKLEHQADSPLSSRPVPAEAGQESTTATTETASATLRRSARLSARQATPGPAVAAQPRPSSRPRARKADDSPSSVGGQGSRSAAKAKDHGTSTVNRRRRRRSGM